MLNLIIEKKDKKMNCRNSLKRGTIYGGIIKGDTTKINHIGADAKNIILEGTIKNLEILEEDGYGLISANLDDGAGMICLAMIGKGNLEFRDLLSKIIVGKEYRILGNVGEDSIILVNKIKSIHKIK